MKLGVLSVGLCALQDGGKCNEGSLSLGEGLTVAKSVRSYCKKDLAPMPKILGHDLQKGTCVHWWAVLLTDGDGQSRLGDSPNEYCRRPCVQPDFSGYEGFVLRQACSFDTTERPSEK